MILLVCLHLCLLFGSLRWAVCIVEHVHVRVRMYTLASHLSYPVTPVRLHSYGHGTGPSSRGCRYHQHRSAGAPAWTCSCHKESVSVASENRVVVVVILRKSLWQGHSRGWLLLNKIKQKHNFRQSTVKIKEAYVQTYLTYVRLTRLIRYIEHNSSL